MVERIWDAEARKVDDCLYKIARSGRYINDKTHKMPFTRLLNCIWYKAHDAQLVEEYDTSQICNRCACEGVRETQGRFECPECGLDDNADRNGVFENLSRVADVR